jgi:hypothetical protein
MGITTYEGKEKHCLKLLDTSIDAILTSQQTHTQTVALGQDIKLIANLEFTVY